MSTPVPGHPGRKPELLAPGGSFEKCRVAFLYGADAVYVSGKDFSLRGFARNLDAEELAAAVFLAHRLGKKVYVAVNVFAREPDVRNLPPYLEYLQDIGADALIVSDPGVLLLARKWAGRVPIHLSTQANTTNSMSVRFWRDQGIRRINAARELSYSELSGIAQVPGVELEVFVHGAMCISYSGRCLLSAHLTGRSANSGLCAQPCRWSYRLEEEKRPGEFFPVFEDGRGSFILSSKDLCLIDELPALMALGVRSFKIEGRMKGTLYLAAVTRAYRRAIDAYWGADRIAGAEKQWMEDLRCVSHRPYTKGLLFPDEASGDRCVETRIAYVQSHTLAGIVKEFPASDFPGARPGPAGMITMEARTRLTPGKELELLYPDGSSAFWTLDRIEDLRGNALPEAHPNTWIRFPAPHPVMPLQVVRTRAE